MKEVELALVLKDKNWNTESEKDQFTQGTLRKAVAGGTSKARRQSP